MTIDLTPEELQSIKELVEQRIAQLGPEIHHTWSRDYKHSLETTREKLTELLGRLSSAA